MLKYELTFLQYGNEPGIDTVYTSAAFIIKIRPSKKRPQFIEKLEEEDSSSPSPSKKRKSLEPEDTQDAPQPRASANVMPSIQPADTMDDNADEAEEQLHESIHPEAASAIALAKAHGLLDTRTAIAKQDYQAESDDQLSFTRGAILLEVVSDIALSGSVAC